MLLELLRVKVQELIVTESVESYPGSIGLPQEIIDATGLKKFELVHVNNKTNGSRILTYVVPSKERGLVTVNGAASKHFNAGDHIHVLSFAYVKRKEADTHVPRIVYTDEQNFVKEVKDYIF